ncbi:MAG: tRNA (adenosine(37)-N6)-threonylcarbamoyltransferase complex dimerization subunit type 1 TsaB [Pseudomonadota bacterium]
MRLLAVDTAEKSCSLALVDDGNPVCESFFASEVNHSRVLMDMIEHLVRTRANVDLDTIDGFVVARGPGSFTGLRIGISVVKGLAFALSKPVAGVCSLDGIAMQLPLSPSPVYAMMDARRGEVYAAMYRFSRGALTARGPSTLVRPEDLVSGIQGPAVFAGSGAMAYRHIIEQALGHDAWFAPGYLNGIRAGALAQVVFDNPGILSRELALLMPVYLRRSDAELNYERHPDRFS